MSVTVDTFLITSNGDDIDLSLSLSNFTCDDGDGGEFFIYLVDSSTFISVDSVYGFTTSTSITFTHTFLSIPSGSYLGSAIIYDQCRETINTTSNTLSHSSSISPPTPPTPPTNGPTGVTTSSLNADNNLDFCIATNATDISFSLLNTLFGRNSGSLNTRLSGLSNPSLVPSLFGYSYLPIDVVTPGKLRQNAVSELKGTCNYGTLDEYIVGIRVDGSALVADQQYAGSNEYSRDFRVIWIHLPSNNIVDRCPFDSSRIELRAVVGVNSAYVGTQTPTPLQINITKRNVDGTAASGFPLTTSRSPTSVGSSSNNREIALSYREYVDGRIFIQQGIVGKDLTTTYNVSLTIALRDNGYDQLASVNISTDKFTLVEGFNSTATAFSWSYTHDKIGGGTASILEIGDIVTSITSTSDGGSGTSTSVGNKTVTLSLSGGTTVSLIVEKDGVTIYNQVGTDILSTTINFEAGFNYVITAQAE
jgi:hypothetical protein